MTYNDAFIRACYKQEVNQVPVWYMRQAGRTILNTVKLKKNIVFLKYVVNRSLQHKSR